LVDRLLGYERLPGEDRLQITPVEWGLLTYGLARTFERLAERPGSLGPWDLVLDRVGPDPFVTQDLGRVLTVRWPTRLGNVSGSIRLWLPETLVSLWLEPSPPPPPELDDAAYLLRFGTLSGHWRA